uniref:DUF5672 domain-containing protein n=1 Tax=Marseillevirus LCMAC201 TaxID=2506605 RepID=A0A481YWJ6_9VIRU|nr:MAG: uncharacterized protein LCMAC201_03000 [Marseillevirus LCMAC201]
MSKLIIWVFIVLVIILICRTCVFPLSAGSVDSGIEAAESLRSQLDIREYPLVAAIVEPREQNLVRILNHFIKVMPAYTHFQVYHGTKNQEILYKNFKSYIQSGKISLWNLGVPNLTIQGYNALLTSKEFWNTIQSERVLIFQTDAITCDKSPFNIENFIKYDFVGAPVAIYIRILISILFLGKGYITGHTRFYNGGLSYRTKSKMLAIIEKYPWDQLTTEDIWFCAFLPRVGGVLPEIKQARQFSFESEQLDYIPWGVHKPRKEYNKLCKICPEFKQIPFIESHTDYRNLYLV